MANNSGNNTNVTRSPTEKIKDNVKLLKDVVNYFQPFSIWNESVIQMKEIKVQDDTPESKLTPEDKLYLIMCTTRDYLSHLCCLIDTEYINHMHLNMYNLYNICGVDLTKKTKQRSLLLNNPIDKDYYYYFKGYVNFAKVPENIFKVQRKIINEKIKELIKRAHSEESQNTPVEITDVHSKSIIVFGHLLHHLVGTMDTDNWVGKTNYFDNYKIVDSDDPRTQPGIEIKIQRKKKADQLESDSKNLEENLNNMNKRSEEDLEELIKSMANMGGNNTNETEIIEDNVKLMKAVFSLYFQPLSIWNAYVKQMDEIKVQQNTPESKLTPEDKLYLIMRTTADYLSHLCCLINRKYVPKMYSNMYNLYNMCGVDLKEKGKQNPLLETDTTDKDYYYYFKGYVNFTKVPENILTVERKIINEKIKELIKLAHPEESQNTLVDITDVHSKSIILFFHLLHHLVGTRDTNDLNGITKYFDRYKIVVSEVPDKKIKIQRIKKTRQFESDWKNLENHWKNMNNLEGTI